jgi:hypothetical protein
MGELTWRMGLLLGGINLSLLGIGAAATNPRRPGNWNLLLALLGFLVYFNLVNLSQAWVSAGKVHIVPTLLTLHGLALGGALALIWWRDHATVTRALRAAPQGARHEDRPQADLPRRAVVGLLRRPGLSGPVLLHRLPGRTGAGGQGWLHARPGPAVGGAVHAGRLYELGPIAVLIGTIYAMARLAQSSEFTILRTAGLGPERA